METRTRRGYISTVFDIEAAINTINHFEVEAQAMVHSSTSQQRTKMPSNLQRPGVIIWAPGRAPPSVCCRRPTWCILYRSRNRHENLLWSWNSNRIQRKNNRTSSSGKISGPVFFLQRFQFKVDFRVDCGFYIKNGWNFAWYGCSLHGLTYI